jgi:choline dehydrogenase
VIGGSSAVNATIALRGVPADYDEWAALGNDEWVLPHFRGLGLETTRKGRVNCTGAVVSTAKFLSPLVAR